MCITHNMSDSVPEVHTVDEKVKEVVNDITNAAVAEAITASEEAAVAAKKAEAAAAAVEEKVEEAAAAVEEEAEAAVAAVEEKIEEAVDDAIDSAEQKTKEVVNEVISEAAIELKEKVDDVKDDVLEALKEKVKDIGVKPSTLTTIIRFTMEAVEKTPTKGSEQKDYALRLIRALVDDFDANDVDNVESDGVAFLRSALDNGTVGDTIDLIVQASRGELDVNTVVEVAATGCLPLCISFLCKKSKSK